VMTLYVLFQDLKAKRIRLGTPLRTSARASRMAPSKLGLKPGETITVDQAIRALVTRSANDVASVVAENLGGSESAFAARMTKTARAIGMSKSTFKNASGLPNPGNWTTARDMATLSLRIQRDFPEYYPYFKIMSFNWKGQTIRTHNKLLGKFAGADGIKTGYIRASGFNLTSSAKRGNKRIVGVVLGATSTPSRNRYMMAMLERQFPKCADGRTIAASIGDKAVAEAAVALNKEIEAPVVAKTKSFGKQLQAEKPVSLVEEQEQEVAQSVPPDPQVEASTASLITASAADLPVAKPTPVAVETKPNSLPFQVKSPAEIAKSGGVVIVPPALASWNIQIGAYPSKIDAQAKLKLARSSGIEVLKGKTAFTMQVMKGTEAIYRARFSGFSEEAAKDACRQLESKGFGCIAYSPQPQS
jgi:D-alanyl-D-alanine carboxypeptidase